jgi:hypothetical protein
MACAVAGEREVAEGGGDEVLDRLQIGRHEGDRREIGIGDPPR